MIIQKISVKLPSSDDTRRLYRTIVSEYVNNRKCGFYGIRSPSARTLTVGSRFTVPYDSMMPGWNQATSGPSFSGSLYTWLNFKWTSFAPTGGNAWYHFGWDFQLWFHGGNVGPCNGHYLELMLHFVAGSHHVFGDHRDTVGTPSLHCQSNGGGYYASYVIAQAGDNSWYSVWPKDITYFFQQALLGVRACGLVCDWNLSQYGVWYVTGGMFGLELGGGTAVGVVDYADFRDSLYGSGGGCSPRHYYVC